MQSLKGKLILDGGALAGSEFHRTVVLICSHNPEGAFGLVLNRRTKEKIEDVLALTLPDRLKNQPLYLGGPVRPELLSCLIYSPEDDNLHSETGILPGLRLCHTLDDVMEFKEAFRTQAKLKFFAGYAGWAPGQLDNEMKQNAWLTHPASIDHIFHPKADKLWKSILRSKGPEFRLLAEMPNDLSSN